MSNIERSEQQPSPNEDSNAALIPSEVEEIVQAHSNMIEMELAREGDPISDMDGGTILIDGEEFDQMVVQISTMIGSPIPVQNISARAVVEGPILQSIRVEGEPGHRVAFMVATISDKTDKAFLAMVRGESVGFDGMGGEEEDVGDE